MTDYQKYTKYKGKYISLKKELNEKNQTGGLGEKSLYDRLGGIFAIAAVVNKFSDALIDNPVVGKNNKTNPFLRDWHTNKLDRLPGLKFMRTLWVAEISGGPYKYTPTKPGKCPMSLENAHMQFRISPEEFDAVAKELKNALDFYKVPEKEQGEVLAAFASHKPDVNTGFYVSKNEKPPVISCPFSSSHK